ncbi:MAG: UDP-N-acetylglucosamine 4,6-dehydratase and UDP-2-acetamido-2,6-dideoxy-alpha-D-xylo-4-hexulose [Pseudomonadota bacterium]|jgi:UDP-N-acetylglucosamine 4,6-dehydratase
MCAATLCIDVYAVSWTETSDICDDPRRASNMLNEKSVLITGGTGSFGKQMVDTILRNHAPRRLVVFSRDELKQFEMSERFSPQRHACLRYFIGDVRDPQRLEEAFRDIDVVIHAAALKQVPAAEYNPFEAVQTNVLGAQNVIRAAIRSGVKKVIALSTDKAANPINLYGATKLCSDKLFVAGNSMAGSSGTRFSVVRYGNVLGSRGSVIPLFMRRRPSGVLPITDERMTRFSITIEQGAEFVIKSLARMRGGELFVPKLPSYRILDVARAIAPEATIETVGIRPGEKLHEVLLPVDEAWHSLEFADYFVIQPTHPWWTSRAELELEGGKPCPASFAYNSAENKHWLSVEELRDLIAQFMASSV